MSQRIRITAKRRAEVDVDKLVFALLRILEAEQRAAQTESPAPSGEGSDGAPGGEESVA